MQGADKLIPNRLHVEHRGAIRIARYVLHHFMVSVVLVRMSPDSTGLQRRTHRPALLTQDHSCVDRHKSACWPGGLHILLAHGNYWFFSSWRAWCVHRQVTDLKHTASRKGRFRLHSYSKDSLSKAFRCRLKRGDGHNGFQTMNSNARAQSDA